MKKSNLFAGLMGLAFMGTSFGFTSCADDRNDLTNSSANTAANQQTLTTSGNQNVADYTLIVYSCGGGNLDADFIQEIYKGYQGFGDKVKMAGVFKPSSHIQNNVKGTDIAGTRYFEAKLKSDADTVALNKDEKVNEKEYYDVLRMTNGKAKDAAMQKNGFDFYKEFSTYFVNEKFDDATMDMGNPNNIADAIKFVAKKNPAKKYILITDNHGGGWNVMADRPNSRAQISDDNVYDELDNKRSMSLDALNAGVLQSGIKFEALHCNLCLMGYIENLVGYQQNFKFCLASAETTTSCYGFDKLGKRLAAAGANISDDELLNQLTSWVKNDEYKSDWHQYKAMEKGTDTDCQDLGVYDLRKINSLTDIMKNIATWYTTAYDNAGYKAIINYAVLTSNYITSPKLNDNIGFYNKRKQFLGAIGYTSDQVANMYANGESEDNLYAKVNALSKEDKEFANYYMGYGVTFSHFVNTTLGLMKANGMDNDDAAKLRKLYNSYQSALKSMAYIKCSHTDFSGMDPYLWTSPSITIHSLNKSAYNKYHLASVDNVGENFSIDRAIASYNNTMFDQQTGWSNFLKKLTVSPCVMTNPTRFTVLFDSL